MEIDPPDDLANLDDIIRDMLGRFQDKAQGGFFNKQGDLETSVFSTIEGLYPILLYHKRDNFLEEILKGVQYILINSKENEYQISPSIEYPKEIYKDCSVDSMSYGLYVLSLSRNYFRSINGENRGRIKTLIKIDPDQLIENIEHQIKYCISYLEEAQKADGSWALLGDPRLEGRTYSTALTVFSLSNCDESDFFLENINKHNINGQSMIADGVRYLLKNNRRDGGWYFSEAGSSEASLAEIRTTPDVNLTATVIFSFGHILRTRWRKGLIDEELSDAIQKGCEFILKQGYEKNNRWINNKSYEPVDYIIEDKYLRTKGNGERDIGDPGFAFPYEMILPAFVLSPGFSIKSRAILDLKISIKNDLNKLRNSASINWQVYDFSDKIFALIYYSYLETVIEEALDRFVRRGECLRCVIDGERNCEYLKSFCENCLYQRLKVYFSLVFIREKVDLIKEFLKQIHILYKIYLIMAAIFLVIIVLLITFDTRTERPPYIQIYGISMSVILSIIKIYLSWRQNEHKRKKK